MNSLRSLENHCFWWAIPFFCFFAFPTILGALVVVIVRRHRNFTPSRGFPVITRDDSED